MEPVRIGLIGCGGMMGAHRRGMELLWEAGFRDFRVVAACDVDLARAEGMADAIAPWQGERPRVFGSVDDLLAQAPEVEAIDTCAVHRAHHEIAVPCLEAGKHLLIEKPLAMTLRAGRLILEAAASAGVKLQVAEQYRRRPQQRAINEAIRSGRIGDPRMLFWIETRERLWHWGWREEKFQAGGGWTLDGGVHFADQFRYHLGPIKTVSAVMRRFFPTRYRDRENLGDPVEVDVEDATIANLEFESGVIGQWAESNVAPGHPIGARVIYGSEGCIDFGQGLKTRVEELTLDELTAQYLSALAEEEAERLYPHGVTDPVGSEIAEFVRAVRGQGEIETDGWEGYRALAISMAVYESATVGRSVTLAEVESLELEEYQGELNRDMGI